MVASTGVEVVDGEAVVVKRVSGGADAVEALRREGERLRRATHPGVVSIVRSAPTPDGWELVLSHGGRSLATVDRPSIAEAATIVAGLASTLADLHEIGVIHGRIEPSHVLLSESGFPRLCGFGDGTASPGPDEDVLALGALLEQLLDGDEPEPIPERRWGARRRRRGWERRALLGLADQATAEDPSRRPTARRLAAAIAATVPVADGAPPTAKHFVDPIERLRLASEDGSPAPPRRALSLALLSVGVVLAILGVQRLRASEVAATVRTPAGSSLADPQVAAPVHGSLVVEGGRRYRVGQEGDHLLVADWACDGHPTPAVFRPSTHEVFVFDRWTSTEPLTVRPTARVTGGVEMLSTTGVDGCPDLALRRVDGAIVPVSLEGLG